MYKQVTGYHQFEILDNLFFFIVNTVQCFSCSLVAYVHCLITVHFNAISGNFFIFLENWKTVARLVLEKRKHFLDPFVFTGLKFKTCLNKKRQNT